MRKVLKYIFHNIICQLLLASGVDRFLRNLTPSKRLIIMYHGVRKGADRINGRHITAEQFEKHLTYYKKNFTIVPLRELCDSRDKKEDPAHHTIALTFDDGFLNNLTVALPLLEKFNIPATFFICGAGLKEISYSHPTDRIDLINASSAKRSMTINGASFFPKRHGPMISGSGAHPYQYLNELPFTQWLQANAELHSQVDDTIAIRKRELYELIDAKTIKALSVTPLVTVGSHSYHHVNLTTLTPHELHDQLLTSKKVLEEHVSSVDMIAFPYGSYNADTVVTSREAGYKYLIAGGNVDPVFRKEVFPRIGILDGQGFAYAMLMINRGFRKFGF